jgi:alkanesulfonate monooxygenase SsuD/methylene tetrahydromethanopterin reductase-like flavin-dependent oxidoreductase (luciferase family)
MSDRVGLALGYDPTASVTQMAAAAADAEGRGLEMVFFSETLFSNRDSVSALAAFALATRRIGLGATQVVRLRSPLLMAQTAATLDELSDGRLVLALGAFTAMHAAKNGVELTDPLPTLREYVQCIRRLLAGESVTYHGDAVHMDDAALAFTPRRAVVPIWIAANTPKGLANAALIGDGILLDAGASLAAVPDGHGVVPEPGAAIYTAFRAAAHVSDFLPMAKRDILKFEGCTQAWQPGNLRGGCTSCSPRGSSRSRAARNNTRTRSEA